MSQVDSLAEFKLLNDLTIPYIIEIQDEMFKIVSMCIKESRAIGTTQVSFDEKKGSIEEFINDITDLDLGLRRGLRKTSLDNSKLNTHRDEIVSVMKNMVATLDKMIRLQEA